MADLFKFRRFEVRHRDSALKVGTDAVLLGAGMTIGDDAENALDEFCPLTVGRYVERATLLS